MQVPAILYGEFKAVRKRCRAMLRRVVREQQPLLSAFAAEGMIDSVDHPGVFALDGPSSLISNYVHFQCYVPLRLLVPGTEQSLGPVGEAAEEAVFSALLEEPWGMLCLLSANNMNRWFARDEPTCYQRYLCAMLRHWDVLDAEGARYSTNSNSGEPLWFSALPVVQALARLGVPRELVRYGVPLPPGGLPALVVRADPALAGDDLLAFAADLLAHPPAHVAPPTTSMAPSEDAADTCDVTFMSEQMLAALEADDVATIERLVLAGEPVDAADPEGIWSLLSWAAEQGHVELVRFLLDHGANIEDRGPEGESPLMLAAQHGHRETVQLLLERGADPHYVTEKGDDVEQFAEDGGHAELVPLLRHARARSEQATPMSAAMADALRRDDPEIVRRLIAAGEPVHVLDRESLQTPLRWAAEQGHIDLVRFLLDRGADVEERSGEGETALMRAAWMGHGPVVRLLLERGADVEAASDLGWQAIDYARARQHAEIAELLEDALAAQA